MTIFGSLKTNKNHREKKNRLVLMSPTYAGKFELNREKVPLGMPTCQAVWQLWLQG
jgi:hypothetical protein